MLNAPRHAARGHKHPWGICTAMGRNPYDEKESRGAFDPAFQPHVKTAGTDIVQCRNRVEPLAPDVDPAHPRRNGTLDAKLAAPFNVMASVLGR